MFGIGIPELLLIVVVGIIFIGPQKLPDVLRAVGKGLVEFKRAANDIKYTVQEEMEKMAEETEINQTKEDIEEGMTLITKNINKHKPEELFTDKKR